MITCRHLGCGKNLPVWLLGLGLVLALGCGDIPGDADETGSVVSVELITGYHDGEDSNTVDVLPGICTAGEGEVTPEPFFDHLARAEITNRPLPNSEEQTASPVYIRYYTIEYEPIDDTINGPLPDLLSYVSIPVFDTRGVPPCQPGTSDCSSTEYILQKFMDVEKKQEYLEAVCGASFHPQWPATTDPAPTVPYPDRCTWSSSDGFWYPAVAQGEYNVRYTFHGENIFGKKFTFKGATVALLLNYNNCD